VLFFTADDGGTGVELWRSDGTASGTVLVADINPGIVGSNPANLRYVDGTLFFTASDGLHGVELWRSDGTTAGTVLVEDLAAGPASSSPLFLTDVDGTLLFQANDGVDGAELWSSDGTPAGTFRVQDINPGAASAAPAAITLAGGRVFFAANDGETGVELWALDNQPPSADAGPDQTVEVGPDVTLDGGASSDPDGNPLLFEWRDEEGVVGRSALLTLPLPLGLHRFHLIVRDGLGGRSDDQVTIEVLDSVAPSVALRVPGPGATVLVGVPQVIEWTASDAGTLEAVSVSLSTDGGVSFEPVPGCSPPPEPTFAADSDCSGLPGTTVSCIWDSPGPAAPDALLRVEACDTASNHGSATLSLSIADPFVHVLAPNQAVTWAPGSSQMVEWGSNLPEAGEVEVELSRDGGTVFETLAASVPARSGAYAWTVTGPPTAMARVRVRWVANPAVGDVSDVDFTINGVPIANAGGPHAGVRNQTIVFDGAGSSDPDGDVLRYLWDFGDGTTETGVSPAHAYAALGDYDVTLVVSDGIAGSDPAVITVTISNQSPVADAGPDYTVELGSPVTLDGSGSHDPDGDPLTYDWRDAAGVSLGDANATTLTLGLGIHDITLTVRDEHGGAASDLARVTVKDTTAPEVAVVAPQGVELLSGVATAIQWTASDAGTLAGFDVFFSMDGGATFVPIPGCGGLPEGARGCPWLAPGPATSEARVQVVARDASDNVAAATAAFTIVDPSLRVIAPDGPVSWGIGSSQSIAWSHNLGSATTVRIELSRDGGASWSVLAASAPNAGTFRWTVSGPSTGSARVRVLWAEKPAVQDESDASFQIATAFVRVTSPNTNVIWSIGTSQTISWSHNLGADGTVRLEISRNGGSTWSVINASVANGSPSSGSYQWTVSGPSTIRARVRAIWTANTAVQDRSNTNFRIR
jgi:ELWxxDGT repeat protein